MKLKVALFLAVLIAAGFVVAFYGGALFAPGSPWFREGRWAETSSGEGDASSERVSAARSFLQRAAASYAGLDSYEARFERESLSSDGRWQMEQAFLKFKKPFTIFMGWSEGSRRGLQVLYADRYFGNKLIVRPPGFLFGLIPLVSLSPDDPRVMKSEGHSIKSAGLGYFLSEFSKSFQETLDADELRILAIRETDVSGEKGTQIDVLFLNPAYDYPRTQVVFSRQHGLPLEIRLFKSAREPVESFRYLGLEMNPPSSSEIFRLIADARIYRKFQESVRSLHAT